MRVKNVVFYGGVLALAAAAAWAGPGSVISSFTGYLGETPTGVYRDADYVYVVSCAPGQFNSGMKFTPTGSFVANYEFSSWSGFVPEDPDYSYLGPSYVTIAAEAGVVTCPKGGGSPVRWDHYDLQDAEGYAYLPGSPYYFVKVSDYEERVFICRFTTGGSLVSSFKPLYGSGLAASDGFEGASGEYLIAHGGSGPCAVYDPAGSLVATFSHGVGSGIRGGTAGPGYPASWGTTLWVVESWGSFHRTVFQIDLGNGNPSALTPASLGKVKALYR